VGAVEGHFLRGGAAGGGEGDGGRGGMRRGIFGEAVKDVT